MMRQQRIRIFAYWALAILAAALSGILLTSGAPLSTASARAQDQLWQELPSDSLDALSANRRSNRQFWNAPRQYRAFQLNEAALAGLLAGAPMDFTEAANDPRNEIQLPMPDGSFARFRFVESPIMAPELAAQFPEIKTYRGWSVDDPAVTMRFALTSRGFYSITLSSEGAFYVAPLFQDDARTHASYFMRDAGGEAFACQVGSRLRAPGRQERGALRQSERLAAAAANGATLRTFRLAVGATAEYTAFFGGTVAGAMTGIVTTVNNVAAIYRAELAVNFTLVGAVIFTNPMTDPYTSGNTNQLIDENQSRLDMVIGANGYDIGHVFDASNAGGLAALGVVCDNGAEG
ncbi:MAG: reprolysin-like metallopeptidase, partial [Blastocatellia bacterium]